MAKRDKGLEEWQSAEHVQRLNEATHIREVDGAPPEPYRIGSHGFMYRWSDVMGQWMRTSIERRRLTRAQDYGQYHR